ncbi:alpha-amylase family protein [Scatolibacter rhodanostii]|uniref:alpha-amylase family protein n=1 Tax=Scatolibacter rhodanostii TaxID=2014781 RepID=UPI000C0830CF|nr:alpha-amylase family protein [Scatolibacter rhodanostii]
MAEKIKPWYENTFRFAQTNFTEDDPASFDVDFWREQWKKTKAQAVVINGGGIVAYYPSRYLLHYQAQFLNGTDFFAEVAAAAREDGLKVIARMDTNRADSRFLQAYPSWFCKDKQGKYIEAAGRYYSCVNSGYYTEFVPDILREIIERYHPEGFTDNNWKGLDRKTICYCENCQRKFREKYGRELPEKPDWNDETYRIWVRWNYEIRLQIWDYFNEVVQEKGGKDCVWCGMLNADQIEQGNRFVDIKKLLGKSKIVFCDQQGRKANTGMEENAVNGSLLRLASEEGMIVPESMANYVRGRRTFRLSANPKEETRLWMIEGIAGGISPWFHHVGAKGYDRRQYETPVPVFQWHEANEKYLYKRQEVAQVGILWSQENTDFYGRENPKERCELPWIGFTKALTKHRIPFLPIHADDLRKYANRINVLILPDIAILSERQTQSIKEFCEAGGSLVLSGLSGTLSQDGEPLPNPNLWEFLGLRLQKGYQGPTTNDSGNWEKYEAHSYIRISENRHDIFSRFEDTDILAFGGRYCTVESVESLKPIGSYIPPFPIFPPEFSWIREEQKELSLLWAGELAGGGRCVYLAGDFDRCYGKDRLPDHGDLLADVVNWANRDEPLLTVSGPGHLDCKLYRQGEKFILHLVNLTGADPEPGYMQEIIPLGPYTISLQVEDKNITTAFLTVAQQTIPVRRNGNRISFTVENIAMHEMLVLQ